MHNAQDNDGTIAISAQVTQPMQGTFVSEDAEGKLIVAKGIVRPPFIDPMTGKIEDVSAVKEAAFGKCIAGGGAGEFYPIREVGKESCRMAYQTLLFGAKDPASLIDWDTARIANMTALSLLAPEARKKVTAGVPVSLLIQDMAPWDMMRRFEVNGIRATAYGSSLVPRGDIEDELTSSISKAFVDAGFEQDLKWSQSWFKVLPATAESLAGQLCVMPDELIGRWFLIHRDPALPDGTSLFPARFGGVLNWATGCTDGHGVVLNPQDPQWQAAGGDFDGDSATIYVPSGWLLPRKAVSRLDYKLNGRTYNTSSIGEQMLESIADSTTQLLGPVILNAMRLAERELDDEDLRILAASAAQASVQAKKHSVDAEATKEAANLVIQVARNGAEDGTRPYISDFLNQMRNVSGAEAKVKVWQTLIQQMEKGVWTNGSSIERALVRRIQAVDLLFKDIGYFQNLKQVNMPQSLRAAAIALTPPAVADAISNLFDEYRMETAKISTLTDVDEEDLKESYGAIVADNLRRIRAKFFLAASTGKLPQLAAPVHEVQCGLIGYGPAKLAAQYCSSETFMLLGRRSKRIIVSLIGHNWVNGVVNVDHLVPVPNCSTDVEAFSSDLSQCTLEVISKAKQSTRVCLSSL